ncbi:calmodulin binding protein PICBP [Neltuma alba]|uniref:calmodulin binding protein PICBP n=1 Tax=Neltuma alba TaxID=207710 RepID=UPI0010A4D60F|nr:calmodulin binding protein PICBP-like [Prosopis alba]
MIHQTFETESTSSSYAKSETDGMPETESSVSSNLQDGGRLEPKKKLKGLRSIRLQRLSSMRSSIKGPKSRNENIDSQSSGRHSSVVMSDASPNYMKATNSSHSKESFQSSERMFTRKNLSRIPTLKLRRSLTRKLSGGTELKRKLKSSRSIKLTSVKGLRSSRQGKNQGKAGTFNDSQSNKHPSENSQVVVTRRLSFKLSSRYMFRSRKVFEDESSQISRSSDSSLHKATCSSTLKDSHFPDKIELPLEGNGSQEVLLTRKVCPYTYCSLHGGHRDNVPPLKRFVSMRRRQLKTQKNTNMGSRPVTKSKHSGNIKKGNQTSRSTSSENPVNITADSSKSHHQNDKRPARDLPVKSRDTPASTFNGGGSSGGDNKENINFRCNAEVLLGETSFPHITFDQYLNDSLAENGYALSSFPAIKEKPDSKFIETASKDSILAARNKCDESTQSVLMDDRTDITNSDLMLPEYPDICDKHSSLKDDSVVACHEVHGVEASEDKQEERNSILELIDPESSGESLNADEYRSVGDQSLDNSKASDQTIVVELASTPAAMCSASKIHKLEEEIMTKDKNIDSEYGMLQETSPQRESEPASTADASYKMPEGDRKYIKMWHLMYKHAVLNNAENGEDRLQSDQEDKKAQGKDGLSSNGVNNSTFQDTDDENENVVKLVQKAFDEILLPEMENISFGGRLKSQGMASEDELVEKGQGKERDGSTSTSRDSPQEEARLKLDDDDDEEKASLKTGNKLEPKTPKSWSRLKKLLLLKRFVKAIDNVRKINFGKPRHLPSDANLQVEKVHLRHLTPGEGKNVEEWMLDHALQKVISKLAPAQKQRVALLVEAFETVLPFQDIENGPPSSAAVETQVTAVQGLDGSLNLGEEATGREREYDLSAKLLLGKAFHSHKTFEEHADDASDNPMAEQRGSNMVEEAKNNPTSTAIDGDSIGKQSFAGNHDKEKNNTIINDNVYLAETKDSVSLSSGMLADKISTSLEEALANEMVNGVSQDMISGSTTEIPSGKSESHGRDFETENLIHAREEPHSTSKSLILKGFARALGSSLAPSASPASPDQSDEPVAGSEESIAKAKPEIKNLEQFPPAEGTMIQREKQNHTGLWYLVYRHMASGIAANDFKPLVDGEDEKEQGYDNSGITGMDTSISDGSIPLANQHIPSYDHPVTDSEAGPEQLEAIKIVEEAIDAILPDAQEHSHDGWSVTDSNISDNSKQFHGVEGVNSEDLYQKEDRVTSDNGMTQEQDGEPELKEGNKPLSRSWSNLKKVVMLRRFIKALEKVRKFNPRGPRYLPAEPDPEAEKVNLRRQDMGERKGSEEWMLDHALRQVVAQLTPARKRKVGLLVEAFETVMPTIKN